MDTSGYPHDASPATHSTIPERTAEYIGIRELRRDLPARIAAAAEGRRSTITRHGRPVASLGPISEGGSEFALLIAAGSVRPPTRSRKWKPTDPTDIAVGTRIDQALRTLRG